MSIGEGEAPLQDDNGEPQVAPFGLALPQEESIAKLLQLAEVQDYTYTGKASGAEAGRLSDLLLSANGMSFGITDSSEYRAIDRADHGVVPSLLLNANVRRSLAEDHALYAYAGIMTADIGCIKLLVKGEAWVPKVIVPGEVSTTGLSPYMVGHASSFIITAAMNMERGATIGEACIFTTALFLGLVNKGNDGLHREWEEGYGCPGSEAVLKVAEIMSEEKREDMLAWCFNMISAIGYNRISNTHLIDTANSNQVDRYLALETNIRSHYPSLATIIKLDTGSIGRYFHGRQHSFSIRGAVGWMIYWTKQGGCVPQLKIRSAPVGDANKAVAICIAAQPILCGHPILFQIMGLFADIITNLSKGMTEMEEEPWRTSSLCALFQKNDEVSTFTCVMRRANAVAEVSAITAAIAAAADLKMLPASYGSSYYIKHQGSQLSGAVSYWKSFFRGVTLKAMTMNALDFKDQIVGTVKRQKDAVPNPAVLDIDESE